MKHLFMVVILTLLARLPAAAAPSAFEPYEPRDRARVVVVEGPDTIVDLKLNREAVHDLVDRGIRDWTGADTVAGAWLSLVRTNDVVGIKVHSAPGRLGGTRPAVVEGVVQGLLAAGVPSTNIIVWDKRLSDLGASGYFSLVEQFGIRLEGATSAGWNEDTYYENPLLGKLVWGDLEFGRDDTASGRRSHVTRLLTDTITRLIVVSPMLNHNEARVAGSLFTLANGSVDNFLRFEGDAYRLEIAIPEICALQAVGDRVALYITDGLIAQYEGGQRSLLHYAWPLKQLRFSRDPVALDMLSVVQLDALRRLPLPETVRTNFTLFNNAELVRLGLSRTNQIDVEFGP